ncbi:hypothetical protein BIV57_10965 [Mangrovactinospora gilvigrisea]|uniref:DUF3995 domain-containing protein n=2 Tax=Mangrovactinospora gilvigrisea TaxID=1428644 RepID=A0A1J7C7I0_9ACTN|nr:hypothetical protein BIV57_10965 [Mangrovactinospora gilvigrisea]
MADSFGAPVRRSTGAAYAACAWGLVFALVSFYRGSGGRTGLDTIGGAIERRALAGDAAIYAAVWITGVLKLLGAGLALALVRPWGRRMPRWSVLVPAWIAAVGLTLYGGLLEVTNLLAATHAVTPAQPVEWKPLWWHLYLWDLSFLVWGLLFAVALRRYLRTNGALRRG